MKISIHNRTVQCISEYKDYDGYTRDMDSFQIDEISGKRVYLTTIKNGRRLSRITKNMVIDGKKVNIKFGKKTVQIGSITSD
jgi:hypothetical protein